MKRGWVLTVGVFFLGACSGASMIPVSEVIPAPTLTFPFEAAPTLLSPTPTIPTASTPIHEFDLELTSTPLEIQTCTNLSEPCVLEGHFWFKAPIFGGNTLSDDIYRFGSTQNQTRETHHGVEFENPTGTIVVSAADGKVIFAGSDEKKTLAWVPNFYGNVVVVRHEIAGFPTPLFSLYGHLSSISVSVGDEIKQGQRIGKVGATGTAQGSHLHFEVRAEHNNYDLVINPLLWVMPEEGYGVIAGVLDARQVKNQPIVINVQRMADGLLNPNPLTSIMVYENESLPVQGDVVFHENFAAGNIPAGQYRLSLLTNGKLIEKVIEVKSKRLTYIHLIVE